MPNQSTILCISAALFAALSPAVLAQNCTTKASTVVSGSYATSAAATSLKELVKSDTSLSTLDELLTQVNLYETIDEQSPVTVFAPTNEAFEAIDSETLASLKADDELLTQVLTYHVVSGAVPSGDLEEGEVETLEGSTLEVSLSDGVEVGPASVTSADLEAGENIVHVIDTVLIPTDVEL